MATKKQTDEKSPEDKLRGAGFRLLQKVAPHTVAKDDPAFGQLFERTDVTGRMSPIQFWLNEDTEDDVDGFLEALAPAPEKNSGE